MLVRHFVRPVKVLLLLALSLAASFVVNEPAIITADDKGKQSESGEQAKLYRTNFEKVGRGGLLEYTKDKDIGLALQAAWEIYTKPIKPNPNAQGWLKYDTNELKKFLKLFSERTKATVPEWWREDFVALSVKEGQSHGNFSDQKRPVFQEIQLAERKWLIQEGVSLSQKDGNLIIAIDKKLFTYPKSEISVTHDTVAIINNKSAAYIAVYSSAGGFSYKVIAFESMSGKQLWETDIWAIDKRELVGPGAKHRTELTIQEESVLVFGAEMWGMYIEAFDLKTGKCRFRFCTSYWGNFSEKWNWK